MVFASVPVDDFAFIAGEEAVKRIASSSFGHRAFCRACGTALYMRVDYQPKTIDFSVATLDEPGKVRPAFHIFWSSRIDWLDWDDGLPKYDRFRPDTRGLEGTEPPA